MSRTNTKMSPTNEIINPQAKIHCATAASPCFDRSDSDERGPFMNAFARRSKPSFAEAFRK
jgi:hypothetical protein